MINLEKLYLDLKPEVPSNPLSLKVLQTEVNNKLAKQRKTLQRN